MSASFDVVIVGGGAAGVGAARRLAQLMVARLDGDRTAVEERAEALERLPDVPLGLQAMAAISLG